MASCKRHESESESESDDLDDLPQNFCPNCRYYPYDDEVTDCPRCGACIIQPAADDVASASSSEVDCPAIFGGVCAALDEDYDEDYVEDYDDDYDLDGYKKITKKYGGYFGAGAYVYGRDGGEAAVCTRNADSGRRGRRERCYAPYDYVTGQAARREDRG